MLIGELKSERLPNWLLKILRQKPTESTPLPQETPPPMDPEVAKAWEIARQPIPKSIDLEELKREQGYDQKGLAEYWKNFDHSLFDDDPPVEEMIKMIGK